MSRMKKIELLYDEFKRMYPSYEERVVEWYPDGRKQLAFLLDNGDRLFFNLDNHKIRMMKKGSPKTIFTDETVWRKEFARRLDLRMCIMKCQPEELSRLTSISRTTIYKYLNAERTPSTFNLEKIAAALDCNPDSLLNDYTDYLDY